MDAGAFHADIVCKIGRQGSVKGAHHALSHHPASASAALASIQAGSGRFLVLHCGLCGETEQLHSLQQSSLLLSRPPSPAPAIQITSHHKIFMNRAMLQQGLATAGGWYISNCPILPSAA